MSGNYSYSFGVTDMWDFAKPSQTVVFRRTIDDFEIFEKNSSNNFWPYIFPGFFQTSTNYMVHMRKFEICFQSNAIGWKEGIGPEKFRHVRKFLLEFWAYRYSVFSKPPENMRSTLELKINSISIEVSV